MSDLLSGYVRKLNRIERTRKLALWGLTNSARDNGEGVDADIQDIAEAALCTERSAWTIRKEFIRIGLLEIIHKGGGKPGDRSIFRLNATLLRQLFDGETTYEQLAKRPETVSGPDATQRPETRPEKTPETRPETRPENPPNPPCKTTKGNYNNYIPPFIPQSPEVSIIDGVLTLSPAEREEWLPRFGGDNERLDLALIQSAAYVQPNSSRPLLAQVRSQLARIAGDRRDRNARTASAAPPMTNFDRKIEGARRCRELLDRMEDQRQGHGHELPQIADR